MQLPQEVWSLIIKKYIDSERRQRFLGNKEFIKYFHEFEAMEFGGWNPRCNDVNCYVCGTWMFWKSHLKSGWSASKDKEKYISTYVWTWNQNTNKRTFELEKELKIAVSLLNY